VQVQEKESGLEVLTSQEEGGAGLTEAQAVFLQESYYRLAFKRNAIMTEKTIEAARGSGRERIVVIAGGFHTAGMTEIWKSKGISYAVLRPKLTARAPDAEQKKPRRWVELAKDYADGLDR